MNTAPLHWILMNNLCLYPLRWGDVLTYSVHAFNHHTDLHKLSGSNEFNLQKRHVALFSELGRRGLQGVSRTAYRLFENSNVTGALTLFWYLVWGNCLPARVREIWRCWRQWGRNGANTSHTLDLLKVSSGFTDYLEHPDYNRLHCVKCALVHLCGSCTKLNQLSICFL